MLVLLMSVLLSGWCVNQQVNFYRVRLVCVFSRAFCLMFNSLNANQISHIIHISGNMKVVFLLEAFSPGQGKAALLWFSNTLTQTIHAKIVHFHSRVGSWWCRGSGFMAVGYCDDISGVVSSVHGVRSTSFHKLWPNLYKARSPARQPGPHNHPVLFGLRCSAGSISAFLIHFKRRADHTIVLGHQNNNGSEKGRHHLKNKVLAFALWTSFMP